MAQIVQTKPTAAHIRVACVIERGKIKPVWFEETDKPGRDRIFIKEICSVWNHLEGAARIINFAVTDCSHNYRLSLNTREFTWTLGISERESY